MTGTPQHRTRDDDGDDGDDGDAAIDGAAPTSIGAATMQADGTLVLQLRAETDEGTLGDAVLTYRVGDPGYAEVLAHLGPLRPGETCLVRPFPD